MSKAKSFFTKEEKEKLVQCIQAAEKNTSGEIRLHIEDHCTEDAYSRGIAVFYELKMEHTAARNGVLFYVAIEDKKFSILADKGINERVPSDFWNIILENMKTYFKSMNYIDGLEYGITEAGLQLKKYFPLLQNDKNELTDEISFE